jgi:hypothetical protein
MRNHRGFYVVTKVPGPMRSLEGGAPEGMSPRVFRNLRRTHKYWNLPLRKQIRLHVNNNATAHFCGGIIWTDNLGRIRTSLKCLETSWSRSMEEEGGTQCLGVGEEIVVA